jgi:hypothetical protein
VDSGLGQIVIKFHLTDLSVSESAQISGSATARLPHLTREQTREQTGERRGSKGEPEGAELQLPRASR